MKTLRKFVPFFLILTMAAVPALRAEDAPADKPEQKRERGPGGRGPNLEQLAQDLNLTDDQKTKLGPILKEQMKKMQELRKDESLSQDQRREKGRTLREESQKEIEAVLTPEQAKKFAEMRQRGPRGGGDRPAKGEKPEDNK